MKNKKKTKSVHFTIAAIVSLFGTLCFFSRCGNNSDATAEPSSSPSPSPTPSSSGSGNTLAAPSISYSSSTLKGVTGDTLPSARSVTNVGGPVSSCSISPNVNTNTGLSFNTKNCQISGTPTTASSTSTYTVTATNASGSSSATLAITTYAINTTDLVAWYKANTGTGVATDGSSVQTWKDQSGEGNAVTQSTTSQRPIYKTGILNGYPVLRFDSTQDQYLSVNSFSFTSWSSPATLSLFVVASKSGTGNQQGVVSNRRVTISDGSTDYTTWLSLGVSSSGTGTTLGVEQSGSDLRQSSYSPGNTGVQIYSVVINGNSSIDMYRNNNSIYSSTSGSFDFGTVASGSTTYFSIGRWTTSAGQYWNGDIAEVLLYSSALNTTQRNAVEEALNAKYAVY